MSPKVAPSASLPIGDEPAIRLKLEDDAELPFDDKRRYAAEFIAIVQTTAQHSADGKFVAAQVRDRTDIGRTRVIQILECFDRLGLTRRQGDLRTLRSNASPILDLRNNSRQTH